MSDKLYSPTIAGEGMEKNYNDTYDAEFSDLVGKTITEITGKVGDETLTSHCVDGSVYQMHYYDDCCASCNLEDVCGDLKDLIGSPIVKAEENSSNENPADAKPETIEYQDSFTWTFYHLSTVKGTVTLRWYGQSNGYYSESVTFERL